MINYGILMEWVLIISQLCKKDIYYFIKLILMGCTPSAIDNEIKNNREFKNKSLD